MSTFKRPVASAMGRRVQRGAALVAPVVLATAAMLVAFVLAAALQQGSLRDALLGAIVGGFVTLVTTLAAQQLQANAERARRAEDQARSELRIMAAVARELAECGANLAAALTGPSAGHMTSLPTQAWRAFGAELGAFWHPHKVAEVALVYHQIESTNEVLRGLGAPADGSTSLKPVTLSQEAIEYLAGTMTQAESTVALMNRRGGHLARRFGWPEAPSEDDY